NSYPGTGKTLGHLSTLLQWHELDPVDEFEMNRNNLIYDNYQHNRNPFIDHPEWAHSIF
ncbi:MAG: endonuclease, partial [Bacilli bacterium]|nr:endonuclease [Bacilli bacterium]